MALTPLPALDRTSATFKTDLDTYFLTALPAFSSEANALQADVTAKQVLANAASADATNQAALAANQVTLAANQVTLATLQAAAAASSAITAGASLWVSGTTYAVGNARYSPINGQTYRRLTAGAGTTDPSADATNWQIINGLVSQNVQIPVNNLPAIRPSLDLDFANSQTVDPRITFTRASTATRTNARGLIELVPAGVPRIDFDPATGACKGLLIEEQRTNLLTYSEQFDNAAWVKLRATVTASAITAPDGTLTTDKLVEDSSASTDHFCRQSASFTAGTAYTKSIFIKAGERNQVELWFFATAFGATQSMLFTLTGNGAAQLLAGSATGSITAIGSGWYRCSMTATATATVSDSIFIRLAASGASYYTGDGTSGLFIWGAQLEAGAFPTSYIPTVASQVTRAADVASMKGANFSSWYRQDEGSFVVSAVRPSAAIADGNVFQVDDGTSGNRISFGTGGGGVVQNPFIISAGVSQATLTQGASTGLGEKSSALAYKINDFAASTAGAASVTDTSGAVPVVTAISLGRALSTGYWNGHIRSLNYYNKRLTNVELQAISTQ